MEKGKVRRNGFIELVQGTFRFQGPGRVAAFWSGTTLRREWESDPLNHMQITQMSESKPVNPSIN